MFKKDNGKPKKNLVRNVKLKRRNIIKLDLRKYKKKPKSHKINKSQ